MRKHYPHTANNTGIPKSFNIRKRTDFDKFISYYSKLFMRGIILIAAMGIIWMINNLAKLK